MKSPLDEISQLIDETKQMRSELEDELSNIDGPLSEETSNYIFGKFFSAFPSNNQALIEIKKDLEHGIDKPSVINKYWRHQGEELLERCISKVESISIINQDLTCEGNSGTITKKIEAVAPLKHAMPFFNRLIEILDDLRQFELIWNVNIPDYLIEKEQHESEVNELKKKLDLKAPNILEKVDDIDFLKRDMILRTIQQFPHVHRSISAAFDRLHSNEIEAYRHCISSCRYSLEGICLDASNEVNWRTGLKKIIPLESDRKQIKSIISYLSGRGLHAGHNPTQAEAEYCLKVTIATIELIISKLNIDK